MKKSVRGLSLFVALIAFGCSTDKPLPPALSTEVTDDLFMEAHKSSAGTMPCYGDQKFTVPITQWQIKKDIIRFYLFYHSVNKLLKPDSTNEPFFADQVGLSERNSKWHHSFSTWIDLEPPKERYQRAIFNDPWMPMQFFREKQSNPYFVSRDQHYKAVFYAENDPPVKYTINCNGKKKTFTAPKSFLVRLDRTDYLFKRVVWLTSRCEAIPRYFLTYIQSRPSRNRKENLTLEYSKGTRPQLLTVKDGDGQGITFHYTGRLLTSVTDPAGTRHTFHYSSIPDENGIPRKKLTGVNIGNAPTGKIYSWVFRYRNPKDPSSGYGGTYTGDAVIYKKNINGEETDYFYEPVTLKGKAPHAIRPTPDDWNARLSKIEWAERKGDSTMPMYYYLKRGKDGEVYTKTKGEPMQFFNCSE